MGVPRHYLRVSEAVVDVFRAEMSVNTGNEQVPWFGRHSELFHKILIWIFLTVRYQLHRDTIFIHTEHCRICTCSAYVYRLPKATQPGMPITVCIFALEYSPSAATASGSSVSRASRDLQRPLLTVHLRTTIPVSHARTHTHYPPVCCLELWYFQTARSAPVSPARANNIFQRQAGPSVHVAATSRSLRSRTASWRLVMKSKTRCGFTFVCLCCCVWAGEARPFAKGAEAADNVNHLQPLLPICLIFILRSFNMDAAAYS